MRETWFEWIPTNAEITNFEIKSFCIAHTIEAKPENTASPEGSPKSSKQEIVSREEPEMVEVIHMDEPTLLESYFNAKTKQVCKKVWVAWQKIARATNLFISLF